METNHQYSILSFQLKDFETSIACFLLSFFLSKDQKVKYLSHLLINHPYFLVNLPMVFIYKFYEKIILIRPPGELREHHLGEV